MNVTGLIHQVSEVTRDPRGIRISGDGDLGAAVDRENAGAKRHPGRGRYDIHRSGWSAVNIRHAQDNSSRDTRQDPD
jgi:hypothetical protein